MQISSRWKWLLVGTTALLVAGCASTPGVTLTPGTLLLGEVMHVLTQEMVNASEIAPGQKHENLSQMLKARGLTDAQIGQGRVVVMSDLIYWNNTVSGNKYRQKLPALVAEGVDVEPGNVVEYRISERGGVVERVRARSLAEGGCYYGDVPVGAPLKSWALSASSGPEVLRLCIAQASTRRAGSVRARIGTNRRLRERRRRHRRHGQSQLNPLPSWRSMPTGWPSFSSI